MLLNHQKKILVIFYGRWRGYPTIQWISQGGCQSCVREVDLVGLALTVPIPKLYQCESCFPAALNVLLKVKGRRRKRGFPKGTGPLIYKSLVRCPWDFIALKGFALFNYQVSDILWLLVKLSDTPWNTKSVAEDGCQDPSPRLENTSKARVMDSTLDDKSNRVGQSQGDMMVSFLSSVILGKLFKCCTLHLQNRGKITSHPQRYCKDAMRSCLSHF